MKVEPILSGSKVHALPLINDMLHEVKTNAVIEVQGWFGKAWGRLKPRG